MLSDEILMQLIPEHEPEIDFLIDQRINELNRERPARRIALWAACLRHQIQIELQEGTNLSKYFENSGFIATGIFRCPSSFNTQETPSFPVVDGYQFGVVVLHSDMSEEYDGPYISKIQLNNNRYDVPVVQLVSHIHPQGTQDKGHVAALFKDIRNDICGVTAAHVVSAYSIGQKVPISCSDCGAPATLMRKAPGLIDAAIVKFGCGGALHKNSSYSINVRPAFEGETVNLYFGESGIQSSTVMLSLQTVSEIKSAAVPKHFLTDVHGHPGDSGSLVAIAGSIPSNRDLVGMYLGETDCEDGNQNKITYGYALDLKQVTEIFRVPLLTGEFNE